MCPIVRPENFMAYNKIFFKILEREETGQSVDVIDLMAVPENKPLRFPAGLPADVATLALEYDIDAIRNAGLIDKGWIDEYQMTMLLILPLYFLFGRKSEEYPRHRMI